MKSVTTSNLTPHAKTAQLSTKPHDARLSHRCDAQPLRPQLCAKQ